MAPHKEKQDGGVKPALQSEQQKSWQDAGGTEAWNTKGDAESESPARPDGRIGSQPDVLQ